MPIHFKSVRAINLSPDGSRRGVDIYFERADVEPPRDSKVESLRRDYEQTVAVLQNMAPTDSEFYGPFNRLLAAAAATLVGNIDGPTVDSSALELVRQDMLKYARTGRNAYLKSLAVTGGIVTVISAAAASLALLVPLSISNAAIQTNYIAPTEKWLLPALLLHPGVCLGVVFTGLVINRTLKFDKMLDYDPYSFTPGMRILFVCIVSYLLLLALWFNVVMLGVGGLLLNSVTSIPSVALLIGLVCGVSEPIIVELLISRFKPVERTGQ